MKKTHFHITLKVLIGYGLLVVITLLSVIYIYNITEKFAFEDSKSEIPRRKVYLVTKTQSLLYESEALSQFVDFGQKSDSLVIAPEVLLNQTIDEAQRCLDSLRIMATDKRQLADIDTISSLIERKRTNTKELLSIWNDSNFEKLYNKNIEKVLASQNKLAKEVQKLKKVRLDEDTVFVRKKPKGFFKRLIDVFSPSKGDTGVVKRSVREFVADNKGGVYNPSDTISSVLKRLQRNVSGQRKGLYALVMEYVERLRSDNLDISRKVNQMLRDIEKQELYTSIERMNYKQDVLRSTSRFITSIGVISVIIVIAFVFFIAKDVFRSQFYRKQLEKAKQYAEDLLHMREKLMLTISHDIRAPLSSVIGYIELLKRLHPDGRQRYYLDNMNASSSHIISLVNDLLDFHRLESNQMELHKVTFDVSALLNEIYLTFKPLAENKGLKLILREKENITATFCKGDPIRIRQIFSNLLSNAIKFTQEGSVVLEYSTMQTKESVLLHVTVTDQGCGIPESDRDRIFSEFSRVTGSEKAEGFGLGLAITRKLISMMNGTLSLQSEVGKGSAFTVDLPLSETTLDDENKISDATSFDKQEASAELAVLSEANDGIRCLLVDDDPIQLSLAEEFLSHLNVTVKTCLNPSEVVDLLRSSHFDVIITDIQMPWMDGFSLLKKIRTLDISNAMTLPVIALSASVASAKSELKKAGFTGFLNKPYTLSQLHAEFKTLFPEKFKKEYALNFDALTAFAGEDKEASLTILKTFCEETEKNVSLFEVALKKNDRKEASRLAHKLHPLFSMIGASDLALKLSKIEKSKDQLSEEEWQSDVNDSITHIRQIIMTLKQKIGE